MGNHHLEDFLLFPSILSKSKSWFSENGMSPVLVSFHIGYIIFHSTIFMRERVNLTSCTKTRIHTNTPLGLPQ